MKSALTEELSPYLAEVAKRPVLTREKETELFQRLEQGDRDARRQIIEANLRFVIKIALQYVGRGIPLADLVQEGNLGLMEVVDKFDYRRGYRFSTYAAFWIRQAIEVAVRKQCNMIRVPIRKSRLLGHVSEAVREFAQAHGRSPTTRELSTILGVDEEKLRHLLQVRETVLSLDAEDAIEEDSSQLVTRLRDEHAPDPVEICMARERRALVEAALATLPPREQKVLRLRFGIGGEEGQSLRAASRELGLSQEGVRRIEQKALNRLRRGQVAQMLATVL
ncbi:MAG: RNA polymerase sigma factor RpoD/SigA [Candidatus Sumerlaeaceae bacterium]|nr:RNA polymerase sigma factor RpoD/SigA [Candidatus Sumerlaeaceae bacterium]